MRIAVLALFLAACSTTIRISRDELQADIDRRFPRDVDMRVVTVHADAPHVELVDNRVGVDLRLRAASTTGGSAVAGTAHVEGQIVYVEAERAFYLRDPKVTNVVIDPEGTGHVSRLVEHVSGRAGTELISLAAMEVLHHHPVYRLDPARPKDAKAIRHLRSVRVRDQQLEVEVGL